MTEPLDTLVRVQDQDTALDQLHHRMSHLPERLELGELDRQRAEVDARIAEVSARVEDLADRQAALERQITEATARHHSLEDRARSGQVSAPRDLQAIDQELHHLAERKVELEDLELELMEEEEPIDAELAGLNEEKERLDRRGEELRSTLAALDAGIHAEIADAQRSRAQLAAGVPPALLERYEKLRHQLGGTGAARLVGNRCDGCHLTLAPVEVERLLRQPPEDVLTCEQCGRILVR